MPRPTDPNDLFKSIYWMKKVKGVIVIHDAKGVIIWANPHAEEVWGGPLLGLKVDDIISPRFRQLARMRLRATLSGDLVPGDIEIEYIGPAGDPFWLRTTSCLAIWRGKRVFLTTGLDKTIERELLSHIYQLMKNYLSKKEWVFVRMRAQGYTMSEIARRWNVLTETVNNYPGKIKKKLRQDDSGYNAMLYYLYFYEFYHDS